MSYEIITTESINEMTEEDKALAFYALKRKVVDMKWSFEIKHGEFISDRGNMWLAKIGVEGHTPLFVGLDEESALKALMQAFQSAMEAIAK